MYKIGVTLRFKTDYYTMHLNRTYYSLLKEGPFELVIIAPSSKEHYQWLATELDGLLITGGLDVDAKYYNQPNHSTNQIEDPIIDQMDLDLIDAFLQAKKPIFGICRGIQVINTYYGGTLIQDIPSEYKTEISHSQKNLDGTTHKVSVVANTDFSRFFSDMEVNSFHHQNIAKLGNNLTINAISEDDLIEGVENEHLFAVQWHPERMEKKHRDAFIQMMINRITKSK